jgi:hypothetical protein
VLPPLSLVLLVGLGVWGPDDPGEILKRGLRETSDYTGQMLVKTESWTEGKSLLQVKVVKGKGFKYTWVHPSNAAGESYIDDGKQIKQYLPDSNVIRVRTSFQTFFPSESERLAMTKQNYTLSFLGHEKRQGRTVQRIRATAKNSQMGVRTMAVDSELPVVFELDHRVGGSTKRLFEVFEFALMENSAIKLDLGAPASAKVVNAWGPKPIKDVKIATGLLGFAPIVPPTLPYGLKIFASQMVGDEKSPFVAMRLTDGLAIAHVYQWRWEKGKAAIKSGIQADLANSRRDIAFAVVTDMPSDVKEKLLDVFSKAAD